MTCREHGLGPYQMRHSLFGWVPYVPLPRRPPGRLYRCLEGCEWGADWRDLEILAETMMPMLVASIEQITESFREIGVSMSEAARAFAAGWPQWNTHDILTASSLLEKYNERRTERQKAGQVRARRQWKS